MKIINFSKRIMLFLLFICIPAYAAMYKWQDKDGNTHYSQYPPTQGTAKIIKVPSHIKQNTSSKKTDTHQAATKEPIAKNDEKSSHIDKIKSQNCKVAKQNLFTLKSHNRIRVEDEKGERILSEKERQDKIKLSEKAIEMYC